jgi:putative DNA primase/helicase
LRGHFIQPTTGSESVQEMMDLASPVKAFVREWCKEGNALEVPRADLYEAFVLWAREQGTPKPAENHVFARDLRAAVPGISSYQPKKDEARYRAYRGIDLTLSAKETLSVCRNSKRDKDRQ